MYAQSCEMDFTSHDIVDACVGNVTIRSKIPPYIFNRIVIHLTFNGLSLGIVMTESRAVVIMLVFSRYVLVIHHHSHSRQSAQY